MELTLSRCDAAHQVIHAIHLTLPPALDVSVAEALRRVDITPVLWPDLV